MADTNGGPDLESLLPPGLTVPPDVDTAQLATAVLAADRRPSDRSPRLIERLAAIGEVELAESLTKGPQPTLRRIVEVATPLLPGCGGVSAILYDHAADTFVTSASTVAGQDDGESAVRVRRDRGATRFIVDSGVGLYVEDIEEDPFGANRMLFETGNYCYVGLPVSARGRTLGVVYAMGRQRHQFDAEDLALLSVVADRAAIVLNAATEHARVARLARHADALSTVTALLTAAPDPTGILPDALGTIAEALELDTLALVPRSPGAGFELVVAGSDPASWRTFARPDQVDAALARSAPTAKFLTLDVGHRTERRATLAAVRDVRALDDRDHATLGQLANVLTNVLEAAAALSDLRGSNAALAHFAHVASHDLRAPLTTVAGFMDLLLVTEGDALSDAGRSYAAQSIAAALRMAETIEALLAHAELTEAVVRRSTDLGEIVAHVLSDLAEPIQSTSARILLGELHAVEADPAALRVVLQNLVANSLKFTRPDAAPVISISSSEDATGWRLTLRDEGAGVKEDEREDVFELFNRGSSPVARGAGIGLATVRRIVAAHGGTVRLEANTPVGTTVIIEVPHADPSTGD